MSAEAQSNYGKVLYTTEDNTRRALHQVFIYFTHLLCLSVICDIVSNDQIYFFTQGVRDAFLGPQYITENRTISFKDVTTIQDFWNYIEFGTLHLLFGETNEWGKHQRRFLQNEMFLNESLMLGPPRLRQVRVRNNTCILHPAFLRYYNTCVAPYSPDVEFTEPDYKGTKYKTASELRAVEIPGYFHSYNTGGYEQMLSLRKEVSLRTVRHLKQIKWLDRASRLVIFEFNILNFNLNIMQSIKMTFEIMPTGLIIPIYKVESVCAQPCFTSSDRIVFLYTLTLYTINVYYTYVEYKKIRIYGLMKSFRKKNTMVNVPRIILVYLSLCCVIYFECETHIYDEIKDSNYEDYVSIDYRVFVHEFNRIVLGLLIFLSWMSLLNYVDFIPVVRTIGRTISLATMDICAFLIMFFITCTAYGSFGVFLFGEINQNFRDFSTAFVTMVRIIINDFTYFDLAKDSQIMSPLFYISYVILMLYIFFSMFISIILFSYATAHKVEDVKPSFLWYFIKKKIYRVSIGLLAPPKYPENDRNLEPPTQNELKRYRTYMEVEDDINIVLKRLELATKIFYSLTNNMEDLLERAKAENMRVEPRD